MALESVRRVACESADTVYNSHVNPMPSRLTIAGVPGRRERTGACQVCAVAISFVCDMQLPLHWLVFLLYASVCECVGALSGDLWLLFGHFLHACVCVCVSACVCAYVKHAPRVFVVFWHLSPFCILLAYCTHLLHSSLSITTCHCCCCCCYC